jgi:hypothetical protein
MHRLSILILAAMQAVLACAAVSRTVRHYYSVTDSVVSIPGDASTFAVELRVAMPGVKEGRGESRDRWYVATADGQWLTVCGFNSNYGAIDDRRGVRLRYGLTDARGVRVAVDSVDVFDHVDALRGFNTLAMEWRAESHDAQQCRLDVLFGDNMPRTLMSVAAPMPVDALTLSSVGRRDVETLMTEVYTAPGNALLTPWSMESLKAHFAATADPLEGFWTYFDRRNDDNRLRLGGKYRLAIVAGSVTGEYDVIYIDGAVTGSDLWHPMMLKAHLTPARYETMWQTTWYDALGEPLDDDEAYATLSTDEGILTLEFPQYNSRIRLSKD